MNIAETNALTCKLTTLELQQRKKTVISNLKQLLLEKKELSDGYTYRFEGNDKMIDLVADFIKTERLCCDFFHFSMAVASNDTFWLSITGPAGTKDFITSELGL